MKITVNWNFKDKKQSILHPPMFMNLVTLKKNFCIAVFFKNQWPDEYPSSFFGSKSAPLPLLVITSSADFGGFCRMAVKGQDWICSMEQSATAPTPDILILAATATTTRS